MKHDFLVIGSGISGATVAERLASSGKKVLVIDAKSHVGGNCYDFRDPNGICVHQYGTHIFHTNDKTVWDYLSRFTQWHPYTHKVLAQIDGSLIPIPFNLNSIRQVFPPTMATRLEEKLVDEFGFGARTTILELRQKSDPDLKLLGDYVYEKVFLHYTLKQWGMKPEELDPAVTARVPIFVSRDDRYFQNRWQGIPQDGYSAMLERMLEHENITVKLGTSWNDVKEECRDWRIFYTGPVDELMDWQFGDLPYRSIELDFREYDCEFFQPNSVVNYPENYDFTRIGEYKYFLNDKSPRTVVSFEYPSAYQRGVNEPYYPIASDENAALYQKYLDAARAEYKDIHFLGRLGDYKYYDMDKAIARALELVESL